MSTVRKSFLQIFFQVADHPIKQCDFTIISGTYNYAIFNNIELWENYLIFNLKKCFNKSSKGVIFNLQKSFKAKIVNNIYYADNNLMYKTLKKISIMYIRILIKIHQKTFILLF